MSVIGKKTLKQLWSATPAVHVLVRRFLDLAQLGPALGPPQRGSDRLALIEIEAKEIEVFCIRSHRHHYLV